MTPKTFGPYRVRSEIGRGGMGVVYDAVHEASGLGVALKVLHESKAASKTARARLGREVEALSRVKHPALVPVIESDLDSDAPWVAMPFVAGRSLWDLIRGLRRDASDKAGLEIRQWMVEALPECTAMEAKSLEAQHPAWQAAMLRLGAEAAEALASAHAAGLIHRDVKPGNMMVDDQGTLRLLDFGLVQDALGPRHDLTLSKEQVGTPLYMSPEQVSRAPVDHRSDIYSLALSLWEAVALKDPYGGQDLAGLYHAIQRDDVPRLSSLVASLPAGFSEVLSASLRKDPAGRYGDAGALARDLRRISHGALPSPPSRSMKGRLATLRRRAMTPSALIVGSCLLIAGGWCLGAFSGGNATHRQPARHASLVAGAIKSARASRVHANLVDAVESFRLALRFDPGNAEALQELSQLEGELEQVRDTAADRFLFSEAMKAKESLHKLFPRGSYATREEPWESQAFVALEREAQVVLDPQASVVQIRRALDGLAALAGQESPEVIPQIQRLLAKLTQRELDPRIATDAYALAGRVYAEGVLPQAQDLLSEAHELTEVHLAAASLLARMGLKLGTDMLGRYAQLSSPLGDKALRQLVDGAEADSLAALISVLDSSEPVRQVAAAQGLARVPWAGAPDKARIKATIRAQSLFRTSDDLTLRSALLDVIGKALMPSGQELLVSTLEDFDVPMPLRIAAVRALSHHLVGDPGAVLSAAAEKALGRALGNDRDAEVRGAAAVALGRQESESEVTPALVTAARADPKAEVQARALLALGKARMKSALPAALQVLRAPSNSLARIGAIISLGLQSQGSLEAGELLTRVLSRSENEEERLSAAWALARTKDQAILPAILLLLPEEVKRADAILVAQGVVEGAAKGLGKLLTGDVSVEFGRALGALPRLANQMGDGLSLVRALTLGIAQHGARLSPRARERTAQAVLNCFQTTRRIPLRKLLVNCIGLLGKLPPNSPVTLSLQSALESETQHVLRRDLALALTRNGDASSGAAYAANSTPRDGEDALVHALIFLNLGQGNEAKRFLISARQQGALTASQYEELPELAAAKWLTNWLQR